MSWQIYESTRWLIHNSVAAKLAHNNPAVQELALNYVAGEQISDAVAVADRLRKQGLDVGFSYLSVSDDARSTSRVLGELLATLGPAARGVELSVKPSTLGLRDSAPKARQVLDALATMAASYGARVTLEMQRPEEYDGVVGLYRQVRREHPSLGITLQVNLKRVSTDIASLAVEDARIRPVIGSYPVPKQCGITDEHHKSLALVRCLRVLFESDAFPIVASHDPRIIDIAQELARRHHTDRYEYQMAYGVRPLEQRRLVDIGGVCRTLVPFGPAWFEYLATRIAARPRMLWSYARALLDKR